jgi:hypothetical protein
VLRVPIQSDADDAAEGMLSDLAVSEDGNFVAVGGATSDDTSDDPRQHTWSVYIFDANTGALKQRIGGLPQRIGALLFYRNHLVVGMRQNGGLRLYKAPDFAQFVEDLTYCDGISELDVSTSGRLVATGLDGWLRLYDLKRLSQSLEAVRIASRLRTNTGDPLPNPQKPKSYCDRSGLIKPSVARFSPDGNAIAVAFTDRRYLAVYAVNEFSDFGVVSPISVKSVATDANIKYVKDVAWVDENGHSVLYGVGENIGGSGFVLRWSVDNTREDSADLVSGRRVTDIRPFGNGVMYSTEEPSIGVFEVGQKVLYSVSFRLACVMGGDTVRGGPAQRSNGSTIARLRP